MYNECCVNYCRWGYEPRDTVSVVKHALIVKFPNITQIKYVYIVLRFLKLELKQILEINAEFC